jgi:sugar lactone lactonase YvrE
MPWRAYPAVLNWQHHRAELPQIGPAHQPNQGSIMRRNVQRRTAVGFIALLALLVPTALPATASAPSRDDVIVLDGATSAEGIAAGEGTTFYAGELMSGDIFRGDIGDRKAKRFIDVPDGRFAVGMKADVRNDLLFVAGGPTGKAYVYNTETKETVAELTLSTKEGAFINDVTLTDDGAWFTNSKYGELYLVKVSRWGEVRKNVRTLTVLGEAGAALQPADFGMNGIAAVRDGRVLIVAHTKNQALYTVNPRSGESSRIKGSNLAFVDGILVKRHTVWAVQNMSNQISRLELSDDLSSFTVKDVITSKHFDIPTTVARFGDTLAAVNAQFNRPASPHEVVLVPAWD